MKKWTLVSFRTGCRNSLLDGPLKTRLPGKTCVDSKGDSSRQPANSARLASAFKAPLVSRLRQHSSIASEDQVSGKRALAWSVFNPRTTGLDSVMMGY